MNWAEFSELATSGTELAEASELKSRAAAELSEFTQKHKETLAELDRLRTNCAAENHKYEMALCDLSLVFRRVGGAK